jgi:hypothetical protein
MSNLNDPGLLEELSLLKEDLYSREHLSQTDLDWYGRTRPVLTDEELNRLGRWTRSAQPTHVIVDEKRQFKILKIAEQPGYPLVIVGLPQYEPKELGKAVSPRVMPTAQDYRVKIERPEATEHVPTNRMRLSCTKWNNPVLNTKGKSRGRGGKTTPNPMAMADLERRLGIKIG